MKCTYSKEDKEWCIKIYSNTFSAKSIEKMHKMLDYGISDILEIKQHMKRVAKLIKREDK